MTLMAGVFSRTGVNAVDDSVCESLRRALSRDPSDSVDGHSDRRACLLKVDIGAYRAPALRIGPRGTVTMLTGDPILALADEPPATRSRTRDLERLHRARDTGDWSLLSRATGNFSAAYYDPAAATLFLIADKLAMRPVYYWLGKESLFFGSALRILETLRAVPKLMDVRALAEITAFGFPLGRRTPYAGIAVLKPGEILEVS